VSDIASHRRWYYLFSLLITIPGVLFILATPFGGGQIGLRFSIDYTGGTEWVIRMQDPAVTSQQVAAVFVAKGLADTEVVKQPDGFFRIRTEPVDLQVAEPTPQPSPSPAASAAASPGASPGASPAASPAPEASPPPTPAENTELPTTGPLGEVRTELEARHGPIAEQAELTTIGPVVSSDLIAQALLLILVGSLGIVGWITVRFHDVKMGVAALVALFHDVLVVVGVFAILGTFVGLQIDALFVTAMLTVIGFSVHDTIVVFDRIRENRSRYAGERFDRIVNHSILQTFGRSINTSFSVVLALLALLLFGGDSIRDFVLALLIGIVSGTYSSIFNASMILVSWQAWEDRRRGRVAGAPGRQRATA
jgi:preprotein translocase subunit SecF